MNSILARLSWMTLATVLVAYALLAGAIYLGIAHYLEERVDDTLSTKAGVMAALIHQDGDHVEFEFDDVLMPEYSRALAPEYFELLRADGSMLERSRSLAMQDLAAPAIPPGTNRTAWNIRLPDGRHGRAVAIVAFPQVEGEGDDESANRTDPLRLVLAQGLEELDSVCAALRSGLVFGGVALLMLVALAVRWSLARGLEPLTALARQVDAVTPESLDVEFSSGEDVRELAGIRTRLDDLIGRLGSAIERERRFASAAAHELRTPLAELKTMAQVADRFPEDQELRSRLPREALVLATRMQSTVEGLLAFARATSHAPAVESQRVDLSAILTRLIDAGANRDAPTRATIQASVEQGLSVAADPALVEAVLRNLLDNALTHGSTDAPITVRARVEAESVLLEFENSCKDLTSRDLDHLFEPFWRKDGSRQGDAHSGLGLALVDAWVRSWGGRVEAALVPPDLVRFSVWLPWIGPREYACRVANDP